MFTHSVRPLFALVLAVTIAGCSATSTQFDWDQQFDFTKLESWSYMDTEPSGAPTDLTKQRVTGSIDKVLADRGYRKVDASPDFRIAWHVGARDKMRARAEWGYQDPYGAYWTGYYGPRTTEITYYEEGTLIVDVIDSAENRLVWRGTATRAFERRPGPDQADEIVLDAVQKLFAGFPPK